MLCDKVPRFIEQHCFRTRRTDIYTYHVLHRSHSFSFNYISLPILAIY